MKRWTKHIYRSQRGFTLVELLVAMAISGLIASGLALTIFQVFNGNAQSSSEMSVVQQVQNVGHWVSRDVMMAQNVTLADPDDPPGSGFPITMYWKEFGVEGDDYQIIYSVGGNQLKREFFINGSLSSTTLIAKYLQSISCEMESGKYILTVSAHIEGRLPATETRTYEIIPRPNS